MNLYVIIVYTERKFSSLKNVCFSLFTPNRHSVISQSDINEILKYAKFVI